MRLQDIENLHNEVFAFLKQKRLKSAFKALKQMSQEVGDWHYAEKTEELETAYQLMLRYLSLGADDPQRDKLYRRTLADCYLLSDIMTDRARMMESNSLYYGKKRLFLSGSDSLENIFIRLSNALNNLSLSDLLEESDKDQKRIGYIRQQMEAESALLFQAVWTSFPTSKSDFAIFEKIYKSDLLPVSLLSQMVSALTLSILQWFDEQKVLLLIDLAENEHAEIRSRALVGLALITLRHSLRMANTPSVGNRLVILFEHEQLIRELRNIQLQFIRTRETERISKTLNEEILPEMMKMDPALYDKIRSKDLFSDNGEGEMNPEWEEYIEKSGIGDKLKEISELQTEGSDVLMSAFANLKSFPFFSEISNWFLPFSIERSEIRPLTENTDEETQTFLNMIANSRFMCNSDKYSFCFSILQIPLQQRHIMAKQLQEQGEEFNRIQKEEQATHPDKQAENLSNQYIQDLYRFFKLSGRRKEFQDPFVQDLTFCKQMPLQPYFNDKRTLSVLSELFFRKEFYDDALWSYRQLSELDNPDANLYQKIGFCLQARGEIEKALEAYKHADIIHMDSLWTLKKIASCEKSLKRFEDALATYKRIEQLQPDNLSIEMNMGHCYLETGQYEEALRHYFKIEFLTPENDKVWRPIAWTSFLCGKMAQAQRYYQKIVAHKPTSLDYINAGHVEWVLHNIPQAIDYYKKSIELENGNTLLFEKTFLMDSPDLAKNGIPEIDLSLMMDQIMYNPSLK